MTAINVKADIADLFAQGGHLFLQGFRIQEQPIFVEYFVVQINRPIAVWFGDRLPERSLRSGFRTGLSEFCRLSEIQRGVGV